MNWVQILPDVLLWRDSCNVYAVLGEAGALIVDAGSGQWLEDGVEELPVPPRALVITHYFRDHAAGAAAAARAGIPVFVPEGEERMFREPREHFRRRETYLIYDNVWDLYAPAEPVEVSGILRDYDRLTLAGCELEVVPLPGATPTQVGLVLRTPRSGQIVAFSAETIHSSGRVPRLAPLQYDYNDLLGAVNVGFSADLLRRRDPDVLLPSLGAPIADAPATALGALHRNLVEHTRDRPIEGIAMRAVGSDTVEPVTDRVWRSTQSLASSNFVVGDSGRALIIDYGYWHATGSGSVEPGFFPLLWPAYSFPERRRPLLHSLDAMRERAGVTAYDAVIPTHYHDDHVCGIPLLQRVLGLECWVPANFAQLLAAPSRHRFPCTWPGPIRVDRQLSLDEPLHWDGIRFDFAPMSGHTRFSALIGWEIDGVRFAHAGDQYALMDDTVPPAAWPPGNLAPNYVYRNGAFVDSYRRSAEWITAFRPDVVLGGHHRPIETDAAYFEQLAAYARRFEDEHERLMVLDGSSPHFGLDSMSGWVWPYRAHRTAVGPLELKVTVRNPLPEQATLELRLSGPRGWTGSSATLQAHARAEVVAPMTISPDGPCRRQPVTVELWADGQPFGQVLEALVTAGHETF